MRFKLLFFLFFTSTILFAQEIGSVKNGTHSLKLIKMDEMYTFVYSDTNSKGTKTEKSFHFPNKDTVYNIINNGFKKFKSHQVIVLTDVDTVVKFQYSKLDNKILFKINHSNLKSKISGTSFYFTQNEIANLFGNP